MTIPLWNENKEEIRVNIGDVVVLKSGSCLMTVAGIARERVECVWFDRGTGELKKEFINQQCLALANKEHPKFNKFIEATITEFNNTEVSG